MQEQDVQIKAEMDAPALTLIERLEIERKRQGLSQDDFGRRLVSASTWYAVRHEERRPSMAFCLRVLMNFPELEGYVWRHLKFRALTRRQRITALAEGFTPINEGED